MRDALHDDADGTRDAEREAIQAEGNGEAAETRRVPTDGEREAYGRGLIAADEIKARRLLAQWPDPLDFAELALRAPTKPQFILADWLPIGYATLLAGHGGVGKSAIGLHLAVCVAMGLPFFGIATERMRVLYLSCEDRESILHWRLTHICAWLGLNMAELAGQLDILDLVGQDVVLWERDPRTGYTITPAFDRLAARVELTRPRLLIVDGVSDTFGGNENARTEVKRYINALLSPLGADGALLILGHVAKPAAASGATGDGYSGSTQWHNAVRARWYLYPETEKGEDGERDRRSGKLMLELQKSNLGRTDQALTFQWNDEARLFLATSAFGAGAIGGGLLDSIRRNKADRVILDAFRKLTSMGQSPSDGTTSTSYLPRLAFDFKLGEGLTKRELGDAMRRHMTDRKLKREQIGTYSNRSPRYGLKET